jgi:hypothetical protein
VLENEVIFGSVNANRRHYENALRSLEEANPEWLNAFISHRVPLTEGVELIKSEETGIKQVLMGAELDLPALNQP